jgi:hypothetical protein
MTAEGGLKGFEKITTAIVEGAAEFKITSNGFEHVGSAQRLASGVIAGATELPIQFGDLFVVPGLDDLVGQSRTTATAARKVVMDQT